MRAGISKPSELTGDLKFYRWCVDQLMGGVGTKPKWATMGINPVGLLEMEASSKRMNGYSIFSEWEKHILAVKQRGLVPGAGLYVHIPFCRTRCRYCPYFKEVGVGSESAEFFLDQMLEAVRFFSPIISELCFHNLYVGGGTPSFLTLNQIERLFSPLLKLVTLEPRSERTFECSPESITADKLRLIKEMGFNRVSMGVQTLKRDTLRAMARGYQDVKMVKSAVEGIRKSRFSRGFNLDLIVGLHKEDVETFIYSFRGVAEMGPDEIEVNVLHPVRGYVRAFYNGDLARCEENIGSVVRPAFDGLMPLADRLGYVCMDEKPENGASWRFLRQDKSLSNMPMRWGKNERYDDQRLFSLFALGPTARSRIFGGFGNMRYEDETPLEKPFSPAAPVYTATSNDVESTQANYAVDALLRSKMISRREFRDLFGVDPVSIFAPKIALLQRLERIEVLRDAVRLRAIEQKEALISSLFFVGRKRLRRKLDAWEWLDKGIAFEIGGRVLELRIDRRRPGQGFLFETRGLVLQCRCSQIRESSLSQKEQLVIGIVRKLLEDESQRMGDLSIQEVVFSLHRRLKSILHLKSPSLRGVQLKPPSFRLSI